MHSQYMEYLVPDNDDRPDAKIDYTMTNPRFAVWASSVRFHTTIPYVSSQCVSSQIHKGCYIYFNHRMYDFVLICSHRQWVEN